MEEAAEALGVRRDLIYDLAEQLGTNPDDHQFICPAEAVRQQRTISVAVKVKRHESRKKA